MHAADFSAHPPSVAEPGLRLGETAEVAYQALHGHRPEAKSQRLPLANDSAEAARAAVAVTGAHSPPVHGMHALLLLLLLLLGLGAGLLLSWRRGGSKAWLGWRRFGGGHRRDELLPPPGFRLGTPHERLHDSAYLQRMLEAEQLHQGQDDDPGPAPEAAPEEPTRESRLGDAQPPA